VAWILSVVVTIVAIEVLFRPSVVNAQPDIRYVPYRWCTALSVPSPNWPYAHLFRTWSDGTVEVSMFDGFDDAGRIKYTAWFPAVR